jgi:peptidyl-dipeptidase Dcp
MIQALSVLAALAAVVAVPAMAADRQNPFAAASSLPYQAPRFDQITDADYQPAIEEGMRIQRAEIDAITRIRSVPTFENTFVPMERSGRMLDRATSAFFAVAQANTNDTLQKIETEIAPRLAEHQDAIYLNPALFARVKAVHDRLGSSRLKAEQRKLVEETYLQFVRAGANLGPDSQARLKEINKQLSSLSTAFEQKLLAAAKAGALVVDSPARLDGLDPGEIDAAAKAAEERGLKDRWVLPLQNTTQQPALQSLTDRETRKAVYDQSWTRASKGDANDTRETIVRMAQLRAEKAALLGYPNYAAYVLEDQMAKSPEAVEAFMEALAPPTRARAIQEGADIQAVIDAAGGGFQLQPWDWAIYSEQVRKARYDLDQNELKPYFELTKVLEDGVFYAATELYGVTFKRRTDLPVYHPDVVVYEVFDKDGSGLGLMYFDYFKRDNKSGGAWMSNFVGQSKLLRTKPVIYNVANIAKPADGQPALIGFDDVVTMFHEFGHALHGLFADQTYPSLSGANVARDVVEFPSQINEYWALDRKVLAHYAAHHETKAPLPQALVDKIKKASTFNKGYEMGELEAAAQLDMQWHTLAKGAAVPDVDAFELAALKRAGVDFPGVPPRYRSTYFLHIWGNGYAAGYYAYLWTQMLADDAFAWFEANGGLTRRNGQRFRDLILSRGHTLEYGPMFRAFYGKDPDIGPMLEKRGLAPEKP